MVEGFFRYAALVSLSLCSGIGLLPSAARAGVPLQQAVIDSLQNAVELNLFNQPPRSAKVRDTLNSGDTLSTARTARAELRFADGSLARVGGQALFRFVSATRTLQLSNGTLLVLVPPNRGQTRIQTPNAAANIRGSALFIRYLPETDVTLVGALTESGIEITNRDRSQSQPLRAGQIAVVARNRIEQVYRFDLATFYGTSALARGLNLQCIASIERSENDQALVSIRAETAAAAKLQTSTEPCIEATAVGGQATNANGSSQRPSSVLPANQQTENVSTIAPPATRLLTPPTVELPAAFPPTIALPTVPTSPLVPPTAANASSPPRLAEPPTIGGITPGITGAPPGPKDLPPLPTSTPGQGNSPVAPSIPGQNSMPPLPTSPSPVQQTP
ncbi:MAG: FecR domain-containing protein [Leptolyngbya sp. BL-A-14]